MMQDLWLGGDVRPWKKLLQDDERKGGPVRSRKKDDDIGSDMLKEMRRERDRNERKLARSGGGKKLKAVWKSTSVSGAPDNSSLKIGDDAADLARSSGEKASPRHRAGVASMGRTIQHVERAVKF